MRKLGRRLRSWMSRERSEGTTASALLLREVPRKVARKGSEALLQIANRVLSPFHERTYAAGIREVLGHEGADPYVVVVVPGILHYVIPCLFLAAKHVPVVLVFNGTRRWEEELLVGRFPRLPTFALRPVPGSMLPHGRVLDLLLRHAERSFGLLDPDLFVFDPDLFGDLDLREGEIAAGAYGFTNRKAALTFPTTHLLALDVPAIQALMARHRIRPSIYTKTPRHLVEPLASLGLGDDNFVKEYLPYYDPLNLVLAMAAYEGFRFRVLNRDDRDVFHVGGVSYLHRNRIIDYFNARLLELPHARPFANRYRKELPGAISPEQARASCLEGLDATRLEAIDRTIDRIAGKTSEA